jgi:putative Mn2+ efflux pump MntP
LLDRVGAVGDALKIVAIVIPMGLDTFGVALALGIAGLPADRRTSIALLFAAFETIMPVVGAVIGAPLGNAIGGAAEYLAAGVLIALGAFVLHEADDDADEGQRLVAMTRRGTYGLLALGVSISIDELAIGVSAGLLGLPLLPIIVAVGIQAFVVTIVGLRLGTRLGHRWQESAERIAGVALIGLGVILLALRAL